MHNNYIKKSQIKANKKKLSKGKPSGSYCEACYSNVKSTTQIIIDCSNGGYLMAVLCVKCGVELKRIIRNFLNQPY